MHSSVKNGLSCWFFSPFIFPIMHIHSLKTEESPLTLVHLPQLCTIQSVHSPTFFFSILNIPIPFPPIWKGISYTHIIYLIFIYPFHHFTYTFPTGVRPSQAVALYLYCFIIHSFYLAKTYSVFHICTFLLILTFTLFRSQASHVSHYHCLNLFTVYFKYDIHICTLYR